MFIDTEIRKLYSLQVVQSKLYSDVVKNNIGKSKVVIVQKHCKPKQNRSGGNKPFGATKSPVKNKKAPFHKVSKRCQSVAVSNTGTPVFNRFALLSDDISKAFTGTGPDNVVNNGTVCKQMKKVLSKIEKKVLSKQATMKHLL